MVKSTPSPIYIPSNIWPALPIAEWGDTCATLHMWTQIVGKLRLQQCAEENHWWHVPLYVTARGLTTSPIPHGSRAFEILFNFIDHRLVILESGGDGRAMKLEPRSVADFYAEFMAHLRDLGLETTIWTTPVEVPDPIPFERDTTHAAYDPEYAQRCWRVLLHSDRVLKKFRSRFLGKVSPVHFFWGSFDMAVTRFSGRDAPTHGPVPNIADHVVREAYSHEVSSVGFWPGGFGMDAMFYAYAYPEPDGFKAAPILPDAATYSGQMGEYILPYEAVRTAADPDAMLLDFCQSTYEAAANAGQWDRAALER